MPTDDKDRRELWGRLTRLRPTLALLITLALFLVVLAAPDWLGAILIIAIAGGLVALLRHTWPVLAPHSRAMRVLVIFLLLGIAAFKLLT